MSTSIQTNILIRLFQTHYNLKSFFKEEVKSMKVTSTSFLEDNENVKIILTLVD